MRVADRPTVSAWRKALALAIALAVAVGVWFSLGGWLFADVSPPPAEAAQQTSKSSDQDVPGRKRPVQPSQHLRGPMTEAPARTISLRVEPPSRAVA
jgi:hypothetical protein